MSPLFDHFRLAAPHYDRVFSFQRTERLQEMLQPEQGGWLLDAGGGTGRVAESLQSVTDRLVILDESQGMLQEARGKGFIAVLGEAEAPPFRNGAFPRALMVDAYHHLRDQGAAASELMRVLAHQGRLVVMEPDIANWRVKWIALLEKLILMRSRFRRADEVQQMFEQLGGRVEIRAEDAHFWAVVDKPGLFA